MNTLALLMVALCVFALGYRFYAAFLATRVLMLDDRRTTPAHTCQDGQAFMPSPKIVLFGHHLRFKLGMNPREAQHLLELRTIPQGHPDYRRPCQKIDDEILRRAPWINETGLLKFVDHNDYPWARAGSEAFQSQEALKRGIRIDGA